MAGQENAEMIQEQSSLMEQPSAGNLNPKVLVEKELEEALAVLTQNGIQV
jgi:ribosome-binding protein aMBF1 (putative translation factor)